jgi:hypothetical protein
MEGMSNWNTLGLCTLNCEKPYTTCFQGSYCPDKYCEMIKMLVDLNATMILRGVNLYDTHWDFKPGSGAYNAAKQLVIDINAAYDCRGLRRPIIQAGIFEHINSLVSTNNIVIPSAIINEFKYEDGFDSNLYLDSNGQPKVVNFSHLRIQFDNPNMYTNTVPDIRKIEARMWILYMAKEFIDFGYKSIHLGQMGLMGINDLTLIYTNEILTRIRSYAAQKNTFVLLTNENKKSQKRDGYNTFLYDFDSNALRVREISSPQVTGDYSCTGSVNSQLFSGTPCASENMKGFIDYCVLHLNQPTISGTSLFGCNYPVMPYNTYFDFGEGLKTAAGVVSTVDGSTWGFNDTRWFGEEIGALCRTHWMDYAISTLRSFDNGHGFMTAPGILASAHPESWGITQVAGNTYLLIDDLPTKNMVASKWIPNPNAGIKITRTCTTNYKGLLLPTYTVSVDNPDLTTIYSWHIQNSNGSWEPFTYGKSRTVTSGSKTIYLRKDNLGFIPSTFGTITATKVVNLPFNCSSPFLRQPSNDSNNSEVVLMKKDKEYEKYMLDNPILVTNEIKINDTEGLKSINEMTLSPNPVSDNFQIYFKPLSRGAYKIQGFNLQGSQVFGLDKQLEQDEVMETEVSTNKWVNGMYIVTIKNEYGEIISTSRLVVNK